MNILNSSGCPEHPLDHLPVISKVHQAPISSISSVINSLSRQTDAPPGEPIQTGELGGTPVTGAELA